MDVKRKPVELGLGQKVEIIERLRKGETANIVAQIYGVGRTSVNDIERYAENIEQHVLKMQSFDKMLKLVKVCNQQNTNN